MAQGHGIHVLSLSQPHQQISLDSLQIPIERLITGFLLFSDRVESSRILFRSRMPIVYGFRFLIIIAVIM